MTFTEKITGMNILILNSSEQSYSTQSLVKAAKKRKHDVVVVNPTDFYLHLSDVVAGYDKIYLKGARLLSKDIDAIIPRIGGGLDYGALVVEHIQRNLRTFSTASGEALKTASNKFLTSQRLSQHKVKIPKTIIAHKPEDYGFLIDKVDGLPAVGKLQRGSQGQGVFMLESSLSASTALQAFSHVGTDIILQQFINTGIEKTDIRAFVVDGQVVAAYKRYAVDKDFRSNYSISGQGKKVKLTEVQADIAIAAANAVSLPVCGVDIMEADGINYCIEVNGNASLKGIETVTGEDVAGKIIEFVEREAGKRQGAISSSSNASASPKQLITINQNQNDSFSSLNEPWNAKAYKALGRIPKGRKANTPSAKSQASPKDPWNQKANKALNR